ncbi:ATP-dependent DNA ligase [Tribonema minus]|uniref:DNA ligase 1 n=1 Tax=Tribonema minus TaxID=303371 RepID=A0A836CMS0_9STRA|nr:ATP-dependent DNA ligase [Tribonema minus]
MTKIEALLDGCGWKAGEAVPYSALCAVFERIEAVTGRLEIQEMLRGFFATVIALTPDDLEACVFLACNQVAPDFEGVELGVGESLLIKAIMQVTGRSVETVKAQYAEEGDLGRVAQRSRGKQSTLSFAARPKPLTVKRVLEVYRSLATTTGTKSQDKKVGSIKGLLVAAAGPEAKYLVRGLQGKLRIGLAKQTVLVSLAQAVITQPPKLPEQEKLEAGVALVKQAYSECPSYSELVGAMLCAPMDALLERCHLKPGLPVAPMLAKPEKSIAKVMARLSGQLVTCEFKYDGERSQIHLLPDGKLRFFTRNSEEATSKYPDLIPVMQAAAGEGVTSYVLDSEVVAIDRTSGQLLPFQVLSTRKRKDETVDDVKVQIVIQAFDLLYLNGRSLLQEPLQARREALHAAFKESPGHFGFAISLDYQENGDTEPIEAFMAEAVKGNCEGLMVKTLTHNATYEPSRRSLNWLKLKKDYLDDGSSVADSLDLVPIGAYYGRGKRAGAFGAYLLACYEPDAEEYQSVCKIGTGFSNERLLALDAMLKAHVIERKPSYFNVGDTIEPDVWLEPCKVWEVRAADLSKSPVHKAAVGKVDPVRGISIRFPRLVRERDDKAPESATSADQILDMYRSQDCIKNNGAFHAAATAEDEDDWEL